MTIEQAIKKAIESGYKNKGNYGFVDGTGKLEYDDGIFLDPTFWQSLGKALGWGYIVVCPVCDESDYEKTRNVEEWLYHWHKFIDYLAEGKNPQDYFKDP